MTWVLILWVYMPPMQGGASNALLSVPGFSSSTECNTAGAKAKTMVSGAGKNSEFVCVEQKKQEMILGVPTKGVQ